MRRSWKGILVAFMTLTWSHALQAQNGTMGYEYLSIPVSVHSAALGGLNATLPEDDISLVFENPALLTNVSNKSLGLGFTSFVAKTTKLSAAWAQNAGQRGVWSANVQYFSYGKMKETDETGTEIGDLSASDVSVQGSFAYLLTDRISGGVTAKFMFSNYASYNAFAMGVDLGLNYLSANAHTSLSIVARNLGGQLKAFHDKHEKLPFDLCLGFTQELANAPIRFSVTMDDITHWKNLNFIQHFIFGVDVLPTQNIWIALGYNVRRGHEMKVLDSSHWAGWNIGFGINIKKLKVGIAYGKWHIGASSIMGNLSYSF